MTHTTLSVLHFSAIHIINTQFVVCLFYHLCFSLHVGVIIKVFVQVYVGLKSEKVNQYVCTMVFGLWFMRYAHGRTLSAPSCFETVSLMCC